MRPCRPPFSPLIPRVLCPSVKETCSSISKVMNSRPVFSNTSALFRFTYAVTPLFATLTKTDGVYPLSSHSGTHASPILRTSQSFLTYPLFFHTLANSFVPLKNSTLLFSSNSKLFCKNTRGGGTPSSLLEGQVLTRDKERRRRACLRQAGRPPHSRRGYRPEARRYATRTWRGRRVSSAGRRTIRLETA